MTRSVQLKEAYEVAEEWGKNCLALVDFHRQCVTIIHDEGTILTYQNTIVKQWKDYYFIFPEHHNISVYHEDDLLGIIYSERKEITKIEKD